MKMAPIYMLIRTSIHSLVNNDLKSVLLNRIRSINTKNNASAAAAVKEIDQKALESTIAFSYDLIREINRMNKRLTEATDSRLQTTIKNEVQEMLSLVEVVNEILMLYKYKNTETIDPLKNKFSLILKNPYQTVEV